MMNARLATLILLTGLSMSAPAQAHTFAVDDEEREFWPAYRSFATRPAPPGDREAAAAAPGKATEVQQQGGGELFSISIPAPGTLAMLLAGLGLMTGIARRKRLDR